MDGEIPLDWHISTLGKELRSILGGGTPSRTVAGYWGGSIPWATVKDLKSPTLVQTEETITEAGLASSASRLVPRGSVVVATRMAVGATVWTDVDVAINQDLKVLVPGDGLDSRYLFHFLCSRQDLLERRGTGTTVSGIPVGDLRRLVVLVPPVGTQRAIAAVLDGIDDAIEQTEAVIERTETLRRALLEDLLTHGVHGWHKEWKHVQGIGTIPADWEIARLVNLPK